MASTKNPAETRHPLQGWRRDNLPVRGMCIPTTCISGPMARDRRCGPFTWTAEVRDVTPGAPCDTVTPETVLVSGVASTVDEIHDGGRAVIRLASVTGARARAVISASTEPSVLPDGDVTLTVTKSDLLYVTPAVATGPSPFGRSGFCGPRAAASVTLSTRGSAHQLRGIGMRPRSTGSHHSTSSWPRMMPESLSRPRSATSWEKRSLVIQVPQQP